MSKMESSERSSESISESSMPSAAEDVFSQYRLPQITAIAQVQEKEIPVGPGSGVIRLPSMINETPQSQWNAVPRNYLNSPYWKQGEG